MLNAVASIANGGRLMRPYVVKARVYDGEVLETEPTVIHTTMTPEHAEMLTDMMVYTVDEGTKKARVEGYAVAGKSGTAQIPEKGVYLKDQVNHTFVGFMPADAPRVAILVRLERPDQSIQPWASDTTGPMFARTGRRIMDYLNLPPDSIRQAVAIAP
jgi:cell division protein FtsI/penicillin-binding protein 2